MRIVVGSLVWVPPACVVATVWMWALRTGVEPVVGREPGD